MSTKKHDVPEELLSGLLANYKKPEDLIGENGLLKQLRKSCKTPRSVWYMSACNGILTGHEAKQP